MYDLTISNQDELLGYIIEYNGKKAESLKNGIIKFLDYTKQA